MYEVRRYNSIVKDCTGLLLLLLLHPRQKHGLSSSIFVYTSAEPNKQRVLRSFNHSV